MRRNLVILAAVLIINEVGIVYEVPTPAQIAACHDDAIKYCAHYLQFPQREIIRACMIENKARLSQQCKDAFK